MWTENFQMSKLDLERQRNQRSNCQHPLDHRKSKRVPEKHLFLLYWLCQSLCVDHSKLWKILKEMGVPDHLTCFLKNLYVGQEATVITRHGTDWFKIGKGVCQGCIWSAATHQGNWRFHMPTPPRPGQARPGYSPLAGLEILEFENLILKK